MNIKNDPFHDPCKGKAPVYSEIFPAVRVQNSALSTGPAWVPPLAAKVKLNSDGSFTPDGRAGAGMVLRDSSGAIIFSACRALFSCRDTLEAELYACMEGLSSSLIRTSLPIELEVNSLEVVKLVQSCDVDRSIYAYLVREIKLMMNLRETSITHIRRPQNKISNCLAIFAREEGRTMTWLGSGPANAVELASSDCNLMGFE